MKVKSLLRCIQKLKRSTSKDEAKREKRDTLIIAEYQNYIDVCQGFVSKAKETIRLLRELGLLSTIQDFRVTTIEEYIRHAERQMDQIRRRVAKQHKKTTSVSK